MSKPIVDPDLDQLDDALEVVADQVGVFLDPETRKKVYAATTLLGSIAAAAGASLLATAGFIGGEVAVQLMAAGGIATAIGSALGAASAALARRNVQ